MFITQRFLILSFISLLLVTVAAIQPAAARNSDIVPGQYIVVFKDGVTNPDQDTDALTRRHRLTVHHRYHAAMRGFAAEIPAGELAALKNDPRVAFVTEDRVVSIDDARYAVRPWYAPFVAQHHLLRRPSPSPTPTPTPTPSQVLPTGVDRVNAENKGNTGAGVNVAVLDTGIDLTHPDLKDNIVGGKNCSSGSSYADGNGHGTHVAGTIAAENNSIGVVGVAPNAKLWAVRVLNSAGSGTWSSVICGIDFVTAHAPGSGGPITVANMSLGGGGTSDNNCGYSNNDPLHQAMCRSRDAGVTYVVAAGNNAGPTNATVPAAYDDAVITVSALADSDGQPNGTGVATSYGADDTFASFSNYGGEVDLGAPGVHIYSTWKGGGYRAITGTSMATPHVTGAAVLYLAANPGAAWTQVRDGLKAIAEALGAGHTDPSGQHPEPVLRADSL